MDIVIHFLHLAAAMIWAGGQLFLALVLGPTLRKNLSPKDRMPLSLAIARQFKRISHAALGVLLLTGIWQVRYVFLASVGSFTHTPYGRLFVLKMGFLMLALVLGVLHDKRWGPAVAKASATPDSLEFKTAVRQMIFWARFNIVVTLGIVAFAAALRHTNF
jgi:putative copper resistance protein D